MLTHFIFNATTGKNITNDILVNAFTLHHQEFPSICALPNNSFVVAWNSWGQDGSIPNSWGVFARMFNGITGNNITREFRLNTYTFRNQESHSMFNLFDDLLAVVWSGEGIGDNHGIYAKLINITSLEVIIEDFQMNTYTQSSQSGPFLSTLTEDIFIASWSSSGQDGDGAGIFARIFNVTSGLFVTEEFQINEYTSGNQWRNSTCVLSINSFVVVWDGVGCEDGKPNDHEGVLFSVFGLTNPRTNGDDPKIANPQITGYNLFLILGTILMISIIILKKKNI